MSERIRTSEMRRVACRADSSVSTGGTSEGDNCVEGDGRAPEDNEGFIMDARKDVRVCGAPSTRTAQMRIGKVRLPLI